MLVTSLRYAGDELRSELMATAAELFSVGQLVHLKSGGPTMTVSNVTIEYADHMVSCQWFVGTNVETNRFPAGTLQLIPDPPQ
jgi:uncharacterized protein YodC (DUF2158 family)